MNPTTTTFENPTIAGRVGTPVAASESTAYQHYRVERREDGRLWELGRGGMGVTYKAVDTNLHSPVALKIIGPQCFGGTESRARFIREARLAARIRHPNVAAIYHLESEAEEIFYSMEFVDGVTAAAWVQRGGPLPPELALDIGMQVTRALTAAHDLKVLHRDIKPTNIMLVRDPADAERVIVKVIDFGLACCLTAEAASGVETCTFVGTPQFASPEQVENLPADIRSDIYSLGCTLWFLLTGEGPFTGSVARVIAQQLTAPPPFERVGHLPALVRDLLRRMLAKDPAERPQTPVALHAEISACRTALAAARTPARPKQVAWLLERWPRGPSLAWGAASFALLAGVVLFLALRTPPPADASRSAAEPAAARGMTRELVAPSPEIPAPKTPFVPPEETPIVSAEAISIPSVDEEKPRAHFSPQIFILETPSATDAPQVVRLDEPVEFALADSGARSLITVVPAASPKTSASKTAPRKRGSEDRHGGAPSLERVRRTIHGVIRHFF